MNDHEMIGKLIELATSQNGVSKDHDFRIFVLCTVCMALIEAAPNKDVLRETFSRNWMALGGPERAANMDPMELRQLKEFPGSAPRRDHDLKFNASNPPSASDGSPAGPPS
jgi:hypothetical protein